MNEYYVYAHLNPDNNEIFYVGKGKGYRKTSKSSRNGYWNDYVSKLGGSFKVLVIQENLTECDALSLEKKIIKKIDWHYSDLTTNISESTPDLNDPHSIIINFQSDDSDIEKRPMPVRQFENKSDQEIVASLLNFPNENHLNKFEKTFNYIYDLFYDKSDELEESDADIFMDIEINLESIKDTIDEYKVGDSPNEEELKTCLEYEKSSMEIILDEDPPDNQKEIILSIIKCLDDQITAGNNGYHK
jgi:hypothetical protein